MTRPELRTAPEPLQTAVQRAKMLLALDRQVPAGHWKREVAVVGEPAVPIMGELLLSSIGRPPATY